MTLSLPTWSSLSQAADTHNLYASAYSKTKDSHYFGVFDADGNILWSMPLTERAHAPLVHPQQTVVGIVARRPGFFIDFFDVSTHQLIKRIEPTPDHHFYGHALFTSNGQRLITQENHYPSGQGKIFIREWPTGKILHTFSSNGIGPHESVFLDDNVLVIANGGLKTHPDNDREILNLDTMSPNVTYISLRDGTLLNSAAHEQKLHKLSIRHLDVNSKGIVALGFQYQGELWEQVPLVGLSHINSNTIEYLPMPEPIRARFKQYCGSVCFDSTGDILAISTPRGGFVAYWHIPTKQFIGVDNCRDVCGLAATGERSEFFMTNGLGKQLKSNPVQNLTTSINIHPEYHWDNHLRRLSI